MNTPSNAGKETRWFCPHCHTEVNLLPTQSQEGETPRYCIGLGEDGEPDFKTLVGPRGFCCDLSEPEDALWCRDLQPAWDRLNELEATLTAAQREIDRLVGEVAGLKADKERMDWLLGVVHREGIIGLTNFLWSMVDDDPAREPDEEPEDDPERLSPTLDRAAIDAAIAGRKEGE